MARAKDKIFTYVAVKKMEPTNSTVNVGGTRDSLVALGRGVGTHHSFFAILWQKIADFWRKHARLEDEFTQSTKLLVNNREMKWWK